MGCLKLTYYENPTPLKVVYSAVNTSALAEQGEKNKSAFLEVVYNEKGGWDNSTRSQTSNSIWQYGISETAVAGIGVTGGFGIAINHRTGDWNFYFNLGYDFGADLSTGFSVTKNTAKPGIILQNNSLRGWGSSNNLSILIVDASKGGDSFKQDGTISNSGATYYSTGGGISPFGLPIGYTRQNNFTWVTGN